MVNSIFRDRSGENNNFWGRRHGPEARAKMSIAKAGEKHPLWGKHHSAETKAKMRMSQLGKTRNLGRILSAETKAKISRAHVGMKPSAETIEKMRRASRGNKNAVGHKVSAEARLKMSLPNLGNQRRLGSKHTAEAKEKVRQANFGKKPCALAIMRMRLASLGNKHALGYRLTPEQLMARSGEHSRLWRGGIHVPYGLGFNRNMRGAIRKRDDYLCQNPQCYLPENGRRHAIHHIDFSKGNNDPVNLLTLCASCHTKTTAGNRAHWIEYYQALQVVRGIGATMELRA